MTDVPEIRPELQQALASESRGVFVTIDVAMEALGLDQRRTYQVAKSEGWRIAPGTRPRQYRFEDIRATYRKRKTTRSTK
jgi:hypothetical protein